MGGIDDEIASTRDLLTTPVGAPAFSAGEFESIVETTFNALVALNAGDAGSHGVEKPVEPPWAFSGCACAIAKPSATISARPNAKLAHLRTMGQSYTLYPKAGSVAPRSRLSTSESPEAVPARDVCSITIEGMRQLRVLFSALICGVAFAQAPIPTITSISPNTVNVNSPGFTLTVYGTNFLPPVITIAAVPASVVTWNGASLTTTYISSTQLTATVPANLLTSAGTAQVRVVNSAAGGTQTSNTVDFTIGTPPPSAQIAASTASLTFTGIAGNDNPAIQGFQVTSSNNTPVNFTVRTDTPAWIVVRPPSGTTPATVGVQANIENLGPGDYTGKVIVSGPNTVEVNISLRLTNNPAQLAVNPDFLRFVARVGGSNPPDQGILVRTTGSGPLDYTAALVRNSGWLRLGNATGRARPGNPGAILVTANVQGLQVGIYRDTVRVTSGSQSQEVPIALFVAPAGPVLGLGTNGAQIEARQGANLTRTRNIAVLNLGESTLNWTAEVLLGNQWVRLDASAGEATPDTPGQLPVTATSSNLTAGVYHALIKVSSLNAVNSPQFFTIVANILPADSVPSPELSPSGLFFIGAANGTAPASQTERVFVGNSSSIGFTAFATTSDGGKWLTVTPTSGNASAQTPGTATVSVDQTGLRQGVYTGELTFSVSTGSVKAEQRTVGVVFIVTPAGTRVAAADGHNLAGCTPTKLVPVNTGLVGSYSSAAAWPVPLSVRLVDDCGDPVLNGQVVASFSSADPSLVLRLSDPKSGLYSGTWTPVKPADPLTLTINVSSPTLPANSLQVTGGVTPNAKAPLLGRNATLHNFKAPPPRGGPLAPGAVAALFGQNLASAQDAVQGGQVLPRSLKGTSVLIGGLDAPLYFVSEGQVNVEIPFELAGDREYAILVNVNGALTAPDTISLAPVQPGIASFADGAIIAQHADGSLVTASAPAKPGEVIIIYLGGLGATNPAVQSGAVSPSAEPLARVVNTPVVTVDDKAAELFYAGLAPGFVGLYQINLKLPDGLRNGELDLVVTQKDVASNTTRISIRQ